MKHKTIFSFLLAWFVAASMAATTYVFGAHGISGPFEIMIAIAMETILAAICLFVVALPLSVILKKYHIAAYWIMTAFVVAGAIIGAFVYDYLAGGSPKWLILGGSVPGAVGGLTFFVVMHLTRQFQPTQKPRG